MAFLSGIILLAILLSLLLLVEGFAFFGLHIFSSLGEEINIIFQEVLLKGDQMSTPLFAL